MREVGGKSGCLWSHFLDEPVDVVIYVMDISNMCQIAQAISQIKSMLIDPNLEVKVYHHKTKKIYIYQDFSLVFKISF